MSAFRVGARVQHVVFTEMRGRVIEVPAIVGGVPMPGTIRVHVEDGIYSTEAWAGEEMWRLQCVGEEDGQGEDYAEDGDIE